MSAGLHHRTPTLQALDNSGLAVRRIDYHRTTATDTATARVTWNNHDAAGRLVAQWDPRLFARLHAGEPTRANLSTLYSLSGLPVATDSVDAGWRLSLFAETGLPRQQWDSRQTQRQIDYDPQLRPLTITESGAGAVLGTSPRVAERFTYGAATPEAARRNQCGRLIRHDDSAGSRTLNDYSFRGLPLSETRHFLKTLDEPHWPESIAERDVLLESGTGATTQWQYGATDDVLAQTDACGHRQRFDYSVSGDQVQVRLRLADGAEQIIVRDVQYDAFGEIQRQTAGNGLISTAEYDPADGRLRRLSTSSPNRAALQDLHYDYDPAGNVVRIEDQAQTTRHFANQRIEPVNTYGYDTLYQLIEATGREALGALVQPGLPELSPAPGDTSQLLNYTQRYHYDAGGNLFELRHTGRQSYTRTLTIADDCNRGLPMPNNGAPPDLVAGFDANGNRLELQAGQRLHWDGQNRLRGVVQVARHTAEDDAERYVYGGDHQRVRKVRTTRAASLTHTAEARYLPNLELRTDTARNEQLQIVTINAGRVSVRCLHWITGKPEGIEADQLRYSVGDHLGSSTLELDARANLVSHEGYYPFGGTAWWAGRSALEACYKTVRYSGKERDATGLYYYGSRYYMPWLGRWLNPDPAGTVDGLNLYAMVINNPIALRDDTGLMLRNVVKAGMAGAGFAYEAYKHANKPEPVAAPIKPVTGSYGDQKADAAIQKISDRGAAFDPVQQAKGSIMGRLQALDHAAHGQLPGVAAIVKGAETAATVAEFSVTGNAQELDKTALAKAAGTDAINNFSVSLKGMVSLFKGTSAAATVSQEKSQQLQSALTDLREQATDTLAVSASVGLGGAALLDAAAAVVPHPVAKGVLMGTSALWKVGGAIHTAEQLGEISKKFEDNLSHETGKNVIAQMKKSNLERRAI